MCELHYDTRRIVQSNGPVPYRYLSDSGIQPMPSTAGLVYLVWEFSVIPIFGERFYGDKSVMNFTVIEANPVNQCRSLALCKAGR